MRRHWWSACALTLAALLCACSANKSQVRSPDVTARVTAVTESLRPGPDEVLFLGAGDIARCSEIGNARATGDLIRGLIAGNEQAKVFTAGDNAYEDGTATQFNDCYEPAWGSFNEQTAPSPGNHDYHTTNATGHFDYFDYYRADPAAKQRGYYSFDLKGWHIVSLNSNIGMDASSPQVAWLKTDLAGTDKPCILAFWHHPLFSSGRHGGQSGDPGRRTNVLWDTLASYGTDIVVNGHDHHYERFDPQDSTGAPSSRGPREFIVGTGGAELRTVGTPRRNSRFQDDSHHGVLVFTLRPNGYRWTFLATDGTTLDPSANTVECLPKTPASPRD